VTLTLRLASVRPVSAVPSSSLAAPLSVGVRHGSSPTCEGSNSTHHRQSTPPGYASRTTQHAATLRTVGRRHSPRTHRALPADSLLNRTKRRPSVSPSAGLTATPASSYRHLSPQSPSCHKRRRSYKTPLFRATTSDSSSGPFKDHYTGILQLRAPLGFSEYSDIITETNICYSNTWVSP
jgi:hypothetical protein